MSYGSTPGEWQGDAADRPQGFGQPPPDQGQAWPASPYGGQPGQQVPPSYGQPGETCSESSSSSGAGVAASKSNFSNPAVVASSIKTQLQKSISDPSSQYYSAGLKVTSVICTKTGTYTDRCVIDTSNGQTVSVTAVISADGRTYVTH